MFPPLIYIDETSSTNTYLKELLAGNIVEEGTAVCAKTQCAGRGQIGNTWESESGKNLTFSIVLYPKMVKVNEQFIISQIVSLAIKDVLSKYTDNISIKWPNDIYWNERKICGILIENSLMGETIEQSIIGIGININQSEFKSDAPNPISLSQITKKEHNIKDILSQMTQQIISYYNGLRNSEAQDIIRMYKNSLFRKNGFYIYNDGETNFEAKIKNIESNGILVLETIEGYVRKFTFKEIKHIL